MSILESLAVEPENARRERPVHPSGWEPGVAWDGTGGTVTVGPLERDPKWDDVLRVWSLDPEEFEVIEPVQFRAWDAAIGDGQTQRMFYYRANVRRRVVPTVDVAALIAEIRRWRPKPPPPVAGERGRIYGLADWQIGKKGTAATVDRILRSYDELERVLREDRRRGRPIDALYALSVGDLVEGCKDHYAMQEFEVELDQRSQNTTVRRLIVELVKRVAPLVPRVIVAGVGGNHGEERKGGKSYTTFGDNRDVEVLEQAAEAVAENPRLGHVSFVVPRNQLTLTLDVSGTIVGLAHGHQSKPRPGGVKEWWKGQMFGMRPVGDATLLITGHYHHLVIDADGPRTHIQLPTMDSGSQWFEESTGVPSQPAAVTFTLEDGAYDDLRFLR